MRYLEIAEQLRSRIATGRLGPGGAIESEAELGRAFGVSRVTVRRALELLRDEGIVTSRKGSGWFAAVDPVRQALGRFSTVEAALEAAGRPARREVLEFGFVAADADVAAALALSPGGEVLRVRRLNRAGADPFAVVTVWMRADLGAHLSRSDVEAATFYDLLPTRGVELGGATQSITAALATDADAALLGVRPGSPLLVCRRTTTDVDGRPVITSEHRYPAHRTSFEVDFARVTPGTGAGPAGLRLLDGDGDGEAAPPASAPASASRRTGARHG